MIRLVLADDHPLIREGLKRVLERHVDLTVIAEVEDGADVISALEATSPDVLLLDLEMPNAPVGSVVGQVLSRWPELPVLILSMHPEEVWAIPMLRAGASGYMVKSQAPNELVEAIRAVHAGRRYVSASVAQLLAEEFADRSERARHSSLSKREFEVLCLIADGKMLKTVGRILEISPRTVSTYRVRILKKLGLHSTADLIAYAVRHRLAMSEKAPVSLHDGHENSMQPGQGVDAHL